MSRSFPSFFALFAPFLACLLPSPALALTLSEALALTSSHPALLVQDLEEQKIARQGEDAGRRGPDTVGLEVENLGGDLPGMGDAELTLSYARPLLDGRKVQASKALARLDRERVLQETERLRWSLSSTVQRTFHEILAVRALAEVASDAVELASGLREIAQGRVDAGSSPESEILHAEIELDRARTEWKKLQGQLRQLVRVLERTTGRASLSLAEIAGELSPDIRLPEITTLEKNLLATHPDLKRLDLEASLVSMRARQARAETRPDFSVSGGVRQLRSAEESDRLTFVVGLETELPNGRANRGERRALEVEGKRVIAEQARTRTELLSQLAENVERFASCREVGIDLHERVLPATERLYALALEGYRLGKTTQLAVLESRKAVIESRREYLTTISDLYQAVDTIEQLCGICLIGESH